MATSDSNLTDIVLEAPETCQLDTQTNNVNNVYKCADVSPKTSPKSGLYHDNFVRRALDKTNTTKVSLRLTIITCCVTFFITLLTGIFIGRGTVSKECDESKSNNEFLQGHSSTTVSAMDTTKTSISECQCLTASAPSTTKTLPTSLDSVSSDFSHILQTTFESDFPTSPLLSQDSSFSQESLKNTVCASQEVVTETVLSTTTQTVLSTVFTNCSSPVYGSSTTVLHISPTPTVSSVNESLSSSIIESKITDSLNDSPCVTLEAVTQTVLLTVFTECSPTVSSSSTTVQYISPTPTVSPGNESLSTSIINNNGTDEVCNSCPWRDPILASDADVDVTPFSALTETEINDVLNLLKERKYATYTQYFDENRITHVYLYHAAKQSVIDYLDNNGSSPGRYARVHIVRPNANPPDVMEYKVGPLNETKDDMTVEQLLPDGMIAFNRRPSESRESVKMWEFLVSEVEALNDLLSESFDNATFQNGVYATTSILPISDINDRVSHVVLYIDTGDESSLRLLPVSCKLHHPGVNNSLWYTSDWYYLSQGPYDSSKDLQSAFTRGDLRKVIFPKGFREQNHKALYPVRNKTLPARKLADMPPPRTYEPLGPRYLLKGSQVSWMGWDFEFSSDSARGPAIFNVKFLGERIAYEISLQDITLIYHPQTNGHGPLVLSDISYLIGSYTKPRSGLDCPPRSTILKTTLFFEGYPFVIDAACVFEADGQRSLWRHSDRGLADHYLVLRTVSTIGNYDYTVEWNFHLDGRVETFLTASGYLYGAFWGGDDVFNADNSTSTPFGYKILDQVLGPIHDHTYAFKVDLDILGNKNTFQSINWKSGESWTPFYEQSNSTNKPPFFYFNHTRYVEHEMHERETSLNVDSSHSKYWTVINENEDNVWGVKRGYRIMPHSKFSEILESNHPMLKALPHLGHHLLISKHKDTEQYATDSLYQLSHPEPFLPSVNRVVLDDENIRNEDLVFWINEKFLHLPSAEDVPMTLSVTSGFTLKPFNYFDRTPVFDLPAHYADEGEPYSFKPCYENL